MRKTSINPQRYSPDWIIEKYLIELSLRAEDFIASFHPLWVVGGSSIKVI